MEDVAGPRWLRPIDLATDTENSTGQRQSGFDQQPHGDRRGVPAARRQAAEQRALGGVVVEMEWLWVELARIGRDLHRIDLVRCRW